MKEKTKLSKKIVALVVCLMLTITMFSNYSFAADLTEATTGNITVNGLEDGVEVNAYKLTTVDIDENSHQPTSIPYTWVEAVNTWITTQSNETFKTYADINNVFNDENTGVTEELRREFYTAMAGAIKGGTLTLSPAGTKTAVSGTVTFEGLAMGTYLLIPENGLKVYAPSAVNLTPTFDEVSSSWVLNNKTVDVKSEDITITKTIVDGEGTEHEKDNYGTNDTIKFKIVADVPQYIETSTSKYFAISDDLTDGLTLTPNSIKVTGLQGTETTTGLTSGNEYTQNLNTTRPDGSQTVDFVLEFTYDEIKAYDKIIVEYTATLAKDDNTVVGSAGNNNTAYLTYSNNPYVAESKETKEDTTTVYTYELDVTKVEKNKHDTILSGAEFTLSLNDTVLYFVKTADGEYYLANEGDADGAATQTLVVGNDGANKGKLKIYGLDAKTYKLTETKAPDNYNLEKTPREIVLTDANPNGLLDVEEGDETTGIATITFENSKGFQLPETGGMGTVMFAAGGVVFVGLGIALLAVVVKKNRK